MRIALTTVLDVLGLLLLLVAAVATDWRLAVALMAVVILVVSYVLGQSQRKGPL